MNQLSLDTTQIELPPPVFDEEKRGNIIRKKRFRLRDVAGQILKDWRVHACGKKPIGNDVAIVVGVDRGAYTAGVETCGSVWACPVCAGKVAERRRADIEAVMKAHRAAGGDIWMMTLTVPHNEFQAAGMLRKVVSKAWTKMVSGNPWKRKRAQFGLDFIKALEATRGASGWHPHMHIALLTDSLTTAEKIHLKAWLFHRWSVIVRRLGLLAPSRRAFDFQKAENVNAVGDYIGKWGADCELAKATTKISKKGGRSPWQLLADAGEGDTKALFLFREYAHAFKGARHLTWSRGLRERYLEEPELSDVELAMQDSPYAGDTAIGLLRRDLWFRILKNKLVPDLLDVAEEEGWSGVLRFLRGNHLALPENCFGGDPNAIENRISNPM